MVKKVLIVDDDSTNRYMLEILLNGYGFEVISAVSSLKERFQRFLCMWTQR